MQAVGNVSFLQISNSKERRPVSRREITNPHGCPEADSSNVTLIFSFLLDSTKLSSFNLRKIRISLQTIGKQGHDGPRVGVRSAGSDRGDRGVRGAQPARRPAARGALAERPALRPTLADRAAGKVSGFFLDGGEMHLIYSTVN